MFDVQLILPQARLQMVAYLQYLCTYLHIYSDNIYTDNIYTVDDSNHPVNL